MKRLKLSLILLIGLGVSQVKAQEQPLTLKECLQYALKNNQRLQQTRVNEEIGKLKTKEVKAQALPQINGNASLTDNLLKQKLVLPGELQGKPGETTIIEAGTTYNSTLSGDLTQQLYNASVFTGLKAAKSGEAYYALQTAKSEEDVIYNVARSYFTVLLTNQKIKVVESNIDKFKQLVKTTTTQFENGLARRIDLDRIKVNLVNATTEKNNLLNTVEEQTNLLKQVMGMPNDASLTFPVVTLEDIEKATEGNIDWGVFNFGNRTEYKLIEKEQELQQLQRKAYIAEYYPTVSLKGNYSYNGMSNKFDLFKGNSTANWFGMASVGLNVKIPIFDGFARRSRVQQAEATIKQLDMAKSESQLSLATDYANAKLKLSNNLNTIRSQRENVELAEEVYTSTKSNYELGLTDLTELLNAETSMAEAQRSYNEALLQYKLAEIDLIKSNGNLKTLLN
ncbi:transporter [Chitinophaga caeni]|uniref:Transporter n=1 Tax=Chitinophaga caeni TaxID=2029983 RepID=A0A291QRL7_9BACT|nr:TolC family protein [Chitinophaga caeni]ATL46532.1 transporter [Chitinophaga caeni]